jgi:hypothetical protein
MRSKIFGSFTACLLLIGATALAGEQALPSSIDSAAQVASARAFKELGGQTGPRLAGMPAPEEMGAASLGEPLAVKMVRLDALQRYQPAAAEATSLLTDLSTLIYPIRVAGEVRGEMVMRKIDGTWSARGFGGAIHAKAMEHVRGLVTTGAKVSPSATLLVRVPALNLEFVGYNDAAGLQLTPIRDLEAAGLKAGQTLPAARVFEQLLPLAQQHNGLPG